MKVWHGLLIVVLLMALPVMSGCARGSKISADEAIAIAKQDEQMLWHPLERYFVKAKGLDGEWEAIYKGKGHWFVSCYIQEKDSELLYSWDYYESSGIIDYRGVEYR